MLRQAGCLNVNVRFSYLGKVGGALIHLLLVIAVIVLIYQLATGGIRI